MTPDAVPGLPPDREPVVVKRPQTALVVTVPEAVPEEDANSPIRQHVLWIALLCALLAFGPIAALELRSGNRDAPAVRATPTPVNGPADTGATPTAKP